MDVILIVCDEVADKVRESTKIRRNIFGKIWSDN